MAVVDGDPAVGVYELLCRRTRAGGRLDEAVEPAHVPRPDRPFASSTRPRRVHGLAPRLRPDTPDPADLESFDEQIAQRRATSRRLRPRVEPYPTRFDSSASGRVVTARASPARRSSESPEVAFAAASWLPPWQGQLPRPLRWPLDGPATEPGRLAERDWHPRRSTRDQVASRPRLRSEDTNCRWGLVAGVPAKCSGAAREWRAEDSDPLSQRYLDLAVNPDRGVC